MKKHYYILAFATLLLAGCSQDDYVGATVDTATIEGSGSEISFGSLKSSITRAEQQSGSTAAATLGYVFNVYGTKTVNSSASNVFAQSTSTSISDGDTYKVWWADNAGGTTSNSKGWEYVGSSGSSITTAGSTTVSLTSDQTIKYWDYSASQYDFIAYANTASAAITDNTITTATTPGFTVSGTSTQIAGLYLADSVKVLEANFNKVVQFTFRNAAAKVRLGIYETVPGYSVTSMTFYYNSGSSDTEAGLDGKFVGDNSSSSSSSSVTYTVTYDTDGKAVLTPSTSSNFTASTYFDFGTFTISAQSALGKTSTTPTWAGGSEAYTSVFPNIDANNIGAMTLSVDYVLTADDKSGETITVTGAKAVVPEAYMKWQSNYAYTYLFKISDNTNGTTGSTENNDPEGLYPITFDAVVIAEADGEVLGTTTTVSTPSITTYQDGSVTTEGIKYVAGSNPIYVTVDESNSGTLATLSDSNLALYSVATGTTEADLQLESTTKTAANTLAFPTDNATVNGQTLETGKYATLTIASAGTYAVQYKYSVNNTDTYAYKVIVVE